MSYCSFDGGYLAYILYTILMLYYTAITHISSAFLPQVLILVDDGRCEGHCCLIGSSGQVNGQPAWRGRYYGCLGCMRPVGGPAEMRPYNNKRPDGDDEATGRLRHCSSSCNNSSAG